MHTHTHTRLIMGIETKINKKGIWKGEARCGVCGCACEGGRVAKGQAEVDRQGYRPPQFRPGSCVACLVAYTFNSYLVSTYYVPGTVVGTDTQQGTERLF